MLLIAYFAIVNIFAFALFAIDKRRALHGGWRVPESRLLFWALIGGWPAAKLAQRLFRHKTRKQPFGHLLNLSGMLCAVCIIALLFVISGWDTGLLSQLIDAQVSTQTDAQSETLRPRVVRLVEW